MKVFSTTSQTCPENLPKHRAKIPPKHPKHIPDKWTYEAFLKGSCTIRMRTTNMKSTLTWVAARIFDFPRKCLVLTIRCCWSYFWFRNVQEAYRCNAARFTSTSANTKKLMNIELATAMTKWIIWSNRVMCPSNFQLTYFPPEFRYLELVQNTFVHHISVLWSPFSKDLWHIFLQASWSIFKSAKTFKSVDTP